MNMAESCNHVTGSHGVGEQETKNEHHIQWISTVQFTYNAWQIVFLIYEYYTSCLVYFISLENKEEHSALRNIVSIHRHKNLSIDKVETIENSASAILNWKRDSALIISIVRNFLVFSVVAHKIKRFMLHF